MSLSGDPNAYELLRYGGGPLERPPTSYNEVHALVPENRQALQKALLRRYPHGVEPVDIGDFFRDRPYQETKIITLATDALALSGFCTGQCTECGLSATPYSQKNRRIFDPEKLIAFLEQFPIGNGVTPLLLYDATDLLDYPYLFDILEYFEHFSDLREIKVPTSCPPGREDLFLALLELVRTHLRKTILFLSVLPSNEKRLSQNGIIDAVRRVSRGAAVIPVNVNFIDPQRVGRARAGCDKTAVTAGFGCGDRTFIDPVDGPCCSEYHIASSRFKNERRTFSVDQERRVYPRNYHFVTRMPVGFFEGPTLYTPCSNYIDLNTGEPHTEVSLRHVAAYLFFLTRNLAEDARLHNEVFHRWDFITNALDQHQFVLPRDPAEQAFYQQMILNLIEELEQWMSTGLMLPNASRDRDRYQEFLTQIRATVSKIPGCTPS